MRTLGEAESLAKAQLWLARDFWFANWPKLRAHVELRQGIGQLKAAFDANDLGRVQELEGMALWMPYCRAIGLAAATTPQPSGVPPTITAWADKFWPTALLDRGVERVHVYKEVHGSDRALAESWTRHFVIQSVAVASSFL